jgi:hypothetical protein
MKVRARVREEKGFSLHDSTSEGPIATSSLGYWIMRVFALAQLFRATLLALIRRWTRDKSCAGLVKWLMQGLVDAKQCIWSYDWGIYTIRTTLEEVRN